MIGFLIDPVYIITALFGYLFMFLIAGYLAPKFANKLSGRFSLYASMILLACSILIIFAFIFGGILYLVGINTLQYFWAIILLVFLTNFILYLFSPILIDYSFSVERDSYLQRLVDEVKERVGIKDEIVALKAKGVPNAFAYGNFLFGKRIAVTESLINMLDEEELKAVIGHELGHHKHKDSVFMLLFGIVPSIIYYLGYTMIWSSLEDRDNRGVLVILGIVLTLVSFLVQILVLAFSRLREYYADYVGAKYVSKEGMQYALAKLYLFYKNNKELEYEIKSSTFRTLFIYAFANPLVPKPDLERIKNAPITEMEFLSTHPPIQKRLKFIDQIV